MKKAKESDNNQNENKNRYKNTYNSKITTC